MLEDRRQKSYERRVRAPSHKTDSAMADMHVSLASGPQGKATKGACRRAVVTQAWRVAVQLRVAGSAVAGEECIKKHPFPDTSWPSRIQGLASALQNNRNTSTMLPLFHRGMC